MPTTVSPRKPKSPTALDKATLLALYRQMVLLRRFELEVQGHYKRGAMPGFLHLYIGNGARVAYSDIDEKTAQEAAANSPDAWGFRLDVGDEKDVQHGVAQVVEKWGRLDILVNNAGINTLHKRVNINEFSLEEWDRVLRVDLTGLFLMSRAASGVMIEQKSGRIINIASVAGLVPLRLQSAFVAAKAGVVNLTKSMAIGVVA